MLSMLLYARGLHGSIGQLTETEIYWNFQNFFEQYGKLMEFGNISLQLMELMEPPPKFFNV